MWVRVVGCPVEGDWKAWRHQYSLAAHRSTLPELVDQLDSLKSTLATADVISVGIAHNSSELASDTPCGVPMTTDGPDWSKMTAQCSKKSAAKYRPQYERLFSTIAEWRGGKPTVLRTINRYNDYIGGTQIKLTTTQEKQSKVFLDDWNTMLCTAAKRHGFGCADIYHAFNGSNGLKAKRVASHLS